MTTQTRINRLTARVLRATDCDDALIDRLFALYQLYYDPTDRAVFERDFRAKTWVIVLSDPQGRDVGFSTIAERVDVVGARRIRSLFSGDTIIEQAFWGEQTLPYRWIELAGAIKAQEPDAPVYWFLISKGHRTYRYMPGFTYAHFPHAGGETPEEIAEIMRVLGQGTFGDAYDQQAGIVRAGHMPTRLRAAFDGMDGTGRNRHAAFFAAANPGYAQGDELLCLCELSADNLRPRARAQFLKGLKRAP